MNSHRLHLPDPRAPGAAHSEALELAPTLTIEAAIECGAAIYEVARGDIWQYWVPTALYTHCYQRRLPFIRVAINRARGTAAVQLAWLGWNQPSLPARLAMEALVERENVAVAPPEVCSQGVWVPAVPLHRVGDVLQQLRSLATVGPAWEAQ